MTRKAVKESVIADHLADHVVEDYEPLTFDLSDKDVLVVENDSGVSDWWTHYFGGIVNISGNEGRVVIIPLEKK